MVHTVGVYQASGQSGYMVAEGSLPTNDTVIVGNQGPNFPVTWNPRYAFAVRGVTCQFFWSLTVTGRIRGEP